MSDYEEEIYVGNQREVFLVPFSVSETPDRSLK